MITKLTALGGRPCVAINRVTDTGTGAPAAAHAQRGAQQIVCERGPRQSIQLTNTLERMRLLK